MGFRTDVRPPYPVNASTSTSTTLASLVIPAVAGQRVCVTGVSFVYGTPAAAAIQPVLREGGVAGTVIYRVGFAQTFTSVQFFNPISTSIGSGLTAQSSTSGAHTVDITLQYYYD